MYKKITSKHEEPEELVEKINKEITRYTEKFVKHYEMKGEPLPIWAAVEMLSFSTL